MAEHSDDLPAEAIAAVRQGNKIEAIRIVREARKLDLKDAKDRVDAYVENDPALKQKLATAQAEATQSITRWLITIGLAILGYYLFIAG